MARSALKQAVRRAPARTVSAPSTLALPEVTADLRSRIGSSQIDEFVLAHGATDILRELVQNEFDGGGSEMVIHFGCDMLSVSGSGRPINAKGWTRLSVIMGTGEVIGEGHGEQIEPKENGIGSKNFGLRALFAYADRIHVRSDGRMAILDVQQVMAGSQGDPDSKGRRGVLVQAPYRTVSTRRLQPFTLEREERALKEIEGVLFPTLVKLALDGRRPGLRRLKVISERTGQVLNWRQNVETVACAVPRVTAQHRKGGLTRRDPAGKETVQTHEEIEFSRYIDIPAEFQDLDFPGYYRHGGRVKVAVSLSLRSGKLQTGRPGRFYYPLEAGQSRTGCAVCVSGPFQLNGDRSLLIKTGWNDWLTAQAADLAVDLVGTDWFDRFGPAGYEALVHVGTEREPGSFQAQVAERLKTATCWPSAVPRQLALAKVLVAPAEVPLAGHLLDSQHLHPDLVASPSAVDLAKASGVRMFTVNSLVRLRCAGQDDSKLDTEIGEGEADYFFTDWVGEMRRPVVQARTANALSELLKRISSDNRRDLSNTISTLSATGELALAKKLVLVPPDMWDGCPVPLDGRLHPDLVPHRAVSRDCLPFDLRAWVIDAADRATAGTSPPSEREALYRYLIASDTKLSNRTLALVRRSPVLKAADGTWVKAEDLLWPAPRDRTLVARAIPQPANEVRTKLLLQRFRIRQELRGADLVAIADAIAGESDACLAFEGQLRRHITLLTARVVESLRELEILRSRAGALATPSALHLPTAINLACLDNPADLVAGEDITLYRQLGCPSRPSSAILLKTLATRRERCEPPPRAEQFYLALVDALRTERQPTSGLLHQAVLWVDGAYATPFLCLVNPRPPKCLVGAVPIHRATGLVADAYLDLGASGIPREQHWTAFFEWIDARASSTPALPIPKVDRIFLADAYRRVAFRMPKDLDPALRWMLSERGTVHSLSELAADRFLENDYPELAEALANSGAPVAFASDDDAARTLFRMFGLKPLSHVCGEARVTVGAPAPAPSWFRADRILAMLHGEDLAEALPELAFAHQKQAAGFTPARHVDIRRRLSNIRHIRFVQSVSRTYTFVKRVSVAAESALIGDELAVRPPPRAWALEHMLATELAQLVGARKLPDVRSLVTAILPLLRAESPAERLDYLRRLGIQPRRWVAQETDDDAGREEELKDLSRALVRGLVETVQIHAPSAAPETTTPKPAPVAAPTKAAPAPLRLPALDAVDLTVSVPVGTAPAPVPSTPSGRWPDRSPTWSPRTAEEMLRDAEIGRRGEEIVYRQELERVRAAGHPNPEEAVVWTARSDAGADHDIRSIGEDGKPIWIEVKSTTGTDGRFDWSRREFEKALREGSRYQLWRVYNAASAKPEAKVFVDPIALIRNSVLRLEIGDLRAFVEAK